MPLVTTFALASPDVLLPLFGIATTGLILIGLGFWLIGRGRYRQTVPSVTALRRVVATYDGDPWSTQGFDQLTPTTDRNISNSQEE